MTDLSQPIQSDSNDHYIEYYRRSDGIHVFNFLGNRPEGVTEWARHMDVIVEHSPADGVILQLMDVQHGVAPLSHMLTEVRGLAARHTVRPGNQIAIIHNSSMSTALFSALLPLLPIHNITIRYFKATEQDAAIGWLLQNN